MQLAGVRVADGTLVWVEGAPPDLNQGDVIRFKHGEIENSGTVSIPTRQIVYCDPDVPRAVFVAVVPVEPTPAVLYPKTPIAMIESGMDSPSGPGYDALLDLAWRELDRLDR